MIADSCLVDPERRDVRPKHEGGIFHGGDHHLNKSLSPLD